MLVPTVGSARGERWYQRRSVIVAAVLVLAIAILIAYVAFLNSSARRMVQREVAIIRAKGEPTTVEDLSGPAIPDEVNAAIPLQRAFEKQAALSEEEYELGIANWHEWLEKPFGPYRVQAAKLMGLHGETLQLAAEALRRPKCRFPLDYSAVCEDLICGPHLPHLRDLGRLFAVEALSHAEASRAGSSSDSIRNVLRLADALENEPLMMSQLVRLNVLHTAYDALQAVQTSHPFAERELRALVADLRAQNIAAMTATALMGERVIVAHTVDRLISGELSIKDVIKSRRDPEGAGLINIRGLLKFLPLREKAAALGVMAKAVDASRLPPWQALKAMRVIRQREAIPIRINTEIVTFLLPAFEPIHRRALLAWARRDAAVIGLSCELYKSRHGRYPDELGRLAPEFLKDIPPDPFTGKPFVYRRKGEGEAAGFIVYSVGDNLTDDGGVKERSSGKDDIAWEGGPGGNGDQAREDR
jgi:hypothetical protein